MQDNQLESLYIYLNHNRNFDTGNHQGQLQPGAHFKDWHSNVIKL